MSDKDKKALSPLAAIMQEEKFKGNLEPLNEQPAAAEAASTPAPSGPPPVASTPNKERYYFRTVVSLDQDMEEALRSLSTLRRKKKQQYTFTSIIRDALTEYLAKKS